MSTPKERRERIKELEKELKELKEVQEASLEQEIEELLATAHDSISKAEAIANEHGLMFSFSVEYGMGGYYDGGDEQRWISSSEEC